MSAHAHLSAEDLLEVALAQGGGVGPMDDAGMLRLQACPECARGLQLARADLRRVCAALEPRASLDSGADAALAQRVLERTTREDLSWRGDWREIARFVRGGLRQSRALRLVAASLLLHLLALPVLAVALVLHLREARAPYTLSYEPPANALPQTPGPHEPLRELVREPEPEPPGPLSHELEPSTRMELQARARLELLAQGAPPVTQPEAASPGLTGRIERLLDARSQRLGLSPLDVGLSEPSPAAPQLELALWAELLLDDWALSAHPDARLPQALARVAAEPGAGSGAVLARHALARAASYGLVVPEQQGSRPEPRPAFERAWFDALEQAGAEQGLEPGAAPLAAWLAWGRRLAR